MGIKDFTQYTVTGVELNNPTSLDFGADGRLYVTQQNGLIKAFTVEKNGEGATTSYDVVDVEDITLVQEIPNHDDDGTLAGSADTGLAIQNPFGVDALSQLSQNERQVTGVVTTTDDEGRVVLYVSSSDPRVTAQKDVGLDTNSGTVSRLTLLEDGTWDMVHLVVGLPRSEENHAVNGMELDVDSNGDVVMYLATGGNTNKGAQDVTFGYTSEYALSNTILKINLTELEEYEEEHGVTEYTPPSGLFDTQKIVYALPTLDDPTRGDVAGQQGVDVGGQEGVLEVFGGNDGLNQAIYDPSGMVEVYSTGYRNQYDVVITEAGKLYTFDNGPNSNIGGKPVNADGELIDDTDGDGIADNGPALNLPSSDGALKTPDQLHLVDEDVNDDKGATFDDGTPQNANDQLYYGGHPNLLQAYGADAGWYLYTQDGTPLTLADSGQVDANGNVIYDLVETDDNTDVAGFISNFADVVGGQDDPRFAVYAAPDFAARDAEDELDGSLAFFNASTNGLDEYTSSADPELQGALLAASFTSTGLIHAYTLNEDGTAVLADNKIAVSSKPLDLIAQGDDEPFAGTIWAVSYGDNALLVLDNGVGGVANEPDPTDRDEDGVADTIDPFAVDPTNGASNVINSGETLEWIFVNGITPPNESDEFFSGGGGLWSGSLGFTGVMTDGSGLPETYFEATNLIEGGAPGVWQVKEAEAGSATENTQRNAFQFGLTAGDDVGGFVIESDIDNFLNEIGSLPSDAKISQGIFVGTGSQSNYVSVNLVRLEDGKVGFEVVSEFSFEFIGETQAQTQFIEVPELANVTADDLATIALTIDLENYTVTPSWSFTVDGVEGSGSADPVFAPSIPGLGDSAFLQVLKGELELAQTNGETTSSGIAVGILSTNTGEPDPSFVALDWDKIRVTGLAKDLSDDNTAPTVSMVVAAEPAVTDDNFGVTLTITDDVAIDQSTLTAEALTFSGPEGGVVYVAPDGLNVSADGKTATLSLLVGPEDGVWDLPLTGEYEFTITPGVIKDVAGNSAPSVTQTVVHGVNTSGDADNDGVFNDSDPFAFDAQNGVDNVLEAGGVFELDFETAGGAFVEAGFTGILIGEGHTDQSAADPYGTGTSTTANARAEDGLFKLTTTNTDISKGDSNDDFTVGLNLGDGDVNNFDVSTSIPNPWTVEPVKFAQVGIVIGDGTQNQNSLVKLTFSGGAFLNEDKVVEQGAIIQLWGNPTSGVEGGLNTVYPVKDLLVGGKTFTDIADVELTMSFDKAAGTVTPIVTFLDASGASIGGTRAEDTEGFVTVPAWPAPDSVVALLNDDAKAAAVGVTANSFGAEPDFEAAWRYLRVTSNDDGSTGGETPGVLAPTPEMDGQTSFAWDGNTTIAALDGDALAIAFDEIAVSGGSPTDIDNETVEITFAQATHNAVLQLTDLGGAETALVQVFNASGQLIFSSNVSPSSGVATDLGGEVIDIALNFPEIGKISVTAQGGSDFRIGGLTYEEGVDPNQPSEGEEQSLTPSANLDGATGPVVWDENTIVEAENGAGGSAALSVSDIDGSLGVDTGGGVLDNPDLIDSSDGAQESILLTFIQPVMTVSVTIAGISQTEQIFYEALDADGQVIASGVLNPNTDASSFDITGQTAVFDLDMHEVAKLRVSNHEGSAISLAQVDYAVDDGSGVNNAPTLEIALADQEVTLGEDFSLSLPEGMFADLDGDALQLRAVPNPLPDGVSFDAETGTFSGTPTQPGAYQISVVAIDPSGAFASDTFVLKVEGDNAPTLEIPFEDQTGVVGEAFSLSLPEGMFADLDGDALQIRAVPNPLPTGLSFNAETGVISGTLTEPGEHIVSIVAIDPSGNFVSDTFKLTVSEGNSAPVLDQAIEDQNAVLGEAFSLSLPEEMFSDLDGDALQLRAVPNPLPAGLSFDAETGVLSGTPTEAGAHQVSIVAIDPSGAFASDTFVVTVTSGDNAPVVETPIADQQIDLGQEFSFSLPEGMFSDLDGDALQLRAVPNPLPDGLSFNAETGEFSGTPTEAGKHAISVVAIDPTGQFVSDTFILDVQVPNSAPVVVAPIADQSIENGAEFSLTVSPDMFSDADDNIKEIRVVPNPLPAGLSYDADTGVISGTPTEAGDHTISVVAIDQAGAFTSDSFKLTVAEAAPTEASFSMTLRGFPNDLGVVPIIDVIVNGETVLTDVELTEAASNGDTVLNFTGGAPVDDLSVFFKNDDGPMSVQIKSLTVDGEDVDVSGADATKLSTGDIIEDTTKIVWTGHLTVDVDGLDSIATNGDGVAYEPGSFGASGDATGSARVSVNESWYWTTGTASGTDQFMIENTSSDGEVITEIYFDMSETLIPDAVIDNDGQAGDIVSIPFSVNSAPGGVSADLELVGDGGADGHKQFRLTVTGGGLAPGESLGFQIDPDPNSIAGSDAPGPNSAGSISGFEMIGTEVTIGFSDGSSAAGSLFAQPTGSVSEGVNTLYGSAAVGLIGGQAAPKLTVEIEGVETNVEASTGRETAVVSNVEGAFTAVVSGGVPGEQVALLVAEVGGQGENADGTFALGLGHGNTVLPQTGIVYHVGTFNSQGVAEISFTGSDSPERLSDGGVSGVNYIAAAQIDENGFGAGAVSDFVVLVDADGSGLGGDVEGGPTEPEEFGPSISGDGYYAPVFGKTVVVEFEDLGSDPTGDWVFANDDEGYTGLGYYEWVGDNTFEIADIAEDGILSFTFNVETAGWYDLTIRSSRNSPVLGDEANDVWVRIDGEAPGESPSDADFDPWNDDATQEWVKVFGTTSDSWNGWSSNFDFGHEKADAEWYLEEGLHTIEFAGRSEGYHMDRFHLSLDPEGGVILDGQTQNKSGNSTNANYAASTYVEPETEAEDDFLI